MSGFFPHFAFDLKIVQNDWYDVSTLIPHFFIMQMNPYQDVFMPRHRQNPSWLPIRVTCYLLYAMKNSFTKSLKVATTLPPACINWIGSQLEFWRDMKTSWHGTVLASLSTKIQKNMVPNPFIRIKNNGRWGCSAWSGFVIQKTLTSSIQLATTHLIIWR